MHDKNTCFDETDKTSNKIYSDRFYNSFNRVLIPRSQEGARIILKGGVGASIIKEGSSSQPRPEAEEFSLSPWHNSTEKGTTFIEYELKTIFPFRCKNSFEFMHDLYILCTRT